MTGALETEFLVRLAVAALLGAILGLERSLAGKHAGMRTYAMVALGSCLFSAVGVLASVQYEVFGAIDPLRVASSVVVGIGFLGAGLVSLRSGGHVELTTAAGIWVAAAIGMASGLGLYVLAIGTTVIAGFIFSLLFKVEEGMRKRFGEQ